MDITICLINLYDGINSVPTVSHKITVGSKKLSNAVVPTFHVTFVLSGLLYIIILLTPHTNITYSFSVSQLAHDNEGQSSWADPEGGQGVQTSHP